MPHDTTAPSTDRDAVSAVRMSERLTAEVDAWAEAHGTVRSTAIRQLVELGLAPRHLPMTLIPLRTIPLRLKIWRSSRSTSCLIHPFPSGNVNAAYAGSPRDHRNFLISA